MKKIVLGLVLISSFVGFSQKKVMPTYEATNYNRILRPSSLTGIQWIGGTHSYVYTKDWKSYTIESVDGKEKKEIKLDDFKASFPKMEYVPYIEYANKDYVVFSEGGKKVVFDYNNKKILSSISMQEGGENDDFSKKGMMIAYTKDNNLYVSGNGMSDYAVTNISDKNIVSGKFIHRNEFGIEKGTFWSDSGKKLAFYQKDETNVTEYPLVDINTVPATVKNIKYPMAGQGSEKAKVGIFDVDSKSVIYLDIDTSDEHYLTNLAWSPDDKYILLAEVNRAQNKCDLNSYDAKTGKKVRTIVTESRKEWVEPEKPAVFLPKSNTEFIWMSEKDEFMNLYIYNLDGKLVKQLTKFKWVVDEVLGFDKKGENVMISGTGDDPREMRTFKVNLKNGKYTDITPVEGTHRVLFSEDGAYALDIYSSVNVPNKIDVVNVLNSKRNNIFTAEDPFKDYYHGNIEFIKIKADDGKTDLYGKVIKPHNFDPNKKYPVMFYVYGGPHAQLVQNRWAAGSEYWNLFMASNEQYIIYTFDNRGSANRGYDFEKVVYRNTATYAMKDQMTAIDYIKKQPFVDSNRLAVFGWSYGGFMTSSLMLRNPGVFKVAVAGGAVIDWKFYEVMYGERYMDTPAENAEGYEDTRITKYIGNLQGKLLYLHGYVDNVVLPQNAMEISEAAIKSNKTIDFFFYPKHEHNVRGDDRKQMVKKIVEYITENNK